MWFWGGRGGCGFPLFQDKLGVPVISAEKTEEICVFAYDLWKPDERFGICMTAWKRNGLGILIR